MSGFITKDWKLKARVVVELHRKKTNMFVSFSVTDDIGNILHRLSGITKIGIDIVE